MRSLISLTKGTTFDTFFNKSNIELANSLGGAVWNESDHRMTAEEIAERIGDCENYVTLWGSPRLDETILDKAPKLKLLTHLGGTVVPFVSDAMWERGIKVISANDYFAESVAEGTLAYMLCALIRLAWFNVDEESRQEREESSRELYLGLPVTTAAIVLPFFAGGAKLLKLPFDMLSPWLLLLVAIAFLTPFRMKKPHTLGKILMILFGAGALALVLIGVKA